MSLRSLLTPVPPSEAPAADRARLGLRWWREVLYVLAFYLVYSAIRNEFGSAAVSPDRAFEHARHVIRIESTFNLFFEPHLQSLFVTRASDGSLDYTFPAARWFLEFWNVFYGTFHFVITAGAMLWLFRRFPSDYGRWRNTLAFTTALALIGFSFYPLMPPRLLADCGAYGACHDGYSFVDTLADVGGLWSFDSGTMQAVSNQYAAMPSLHFAWSTWCFLVLYPRLRRRWLRVLAALYPAATLWAIVVTANHYWLDAVGGLAILSVGLLLGTRLDRWQAERRHQRHAAASTPGMVTTPGKGYGAPAAGGQPADETKRRASSPHVPGDDQQPG